MPQRPNYLKIENKWFRGTNGLHTKLVKVESVEWVRKQNDPKFIDKYNSIATVSGTDGNVEEMHVSELVSSRWTMIGGTRSLAREIREQEEKLKKGKELLQRQENDNNWRERIIEQLQKIA